MSAARPKIGRIIPKPKLPAGGEACTSKTSTTPVKTTAAKNAGPLATSGAKASGIKRNVKQKVPPRPPQPVHKGKAKGRSPLFTRQPGTVEVTALPPPHEPISVGSSDEDEDFEEVPIPAVAGPSSPYPGAPTTPGTNLTHAGTPGTITTAPSVDDDYGGYGEDGSEGEEEGGSEDGVIRLEIGGETPDARAKRIALALRKKPMTSKDRAIRLEAHKLHVVALLASAGVRNRWCTHNLLKARLLSLLPHPLQAAFSIPPSRFPDRAQRSRLFFDALQSLVTWWSQSFFDISDATLGLRTRPWDEVQEIVDQLPRLTRADFFGGGYIRKGAQDDEKFAQGSGGEKLRTVNSMMKKVLQQEGSRDVSPQLFVALARACGLGVRLVASLQAVPWRAEKVVAKKKPGAGRGGRTVASRQGNGPSSEEEETDEDDLEEVPIPRPVEEVVREKLPTSTKGGIRGAGKRRLQDPADLYRLRKPKPAPQTIGTPIKPKVKVKQDLSQQPSVFWAEVFSRSDQRWVPVDPLQGTIRKKGQFEPTSDNGPVRMLYVVAFEEDGYARDVTLRYTKNFGAKTAKLRVPTKKDEPDWWIDVMAILARPSRLHRDDLEDAELETSQISEGMPMHMNGFKDHPIYVLERHLKREEVIQPKREVGRFKGEPVYRRGNVLSCKTAENWMRIGRRVRDKQEPLKWVKQRAVTIQKRRAQELAVQEGQDPIQQGLYSQAQTELYRPPPIVDGKIPQNSFGNLDLYVPTMLPAGSVHLPYKGIAKLAKALGISHAEACTGFEFKKQRAIPVITGIVVAEEQEGYVLEAYWKSAAAAEEREKAKKEEKALKRWVKLINGLRVKARLQAEYGTGDGLQDQQVNPLANPIENTAAAPARKSALAAIADATREGQTAWQERHRDRSPTAEHDKVSLSAAPLDDAVELTKSRTNLPSGITGDTKSEEAIAAEAEDRFAPAADGLVDEHGEIAVIDLAPSPHEGIVMPNQNGTTNSGAKADVSAPRRPQRAARKRKALSPTPSMTFQSSRTLPNKASKRERGRRATTTSTSTITRTLRSRIPKTEEQEQEETDKRRRVIKALASDGEDDED